MRWDTPTGLEWTRSQEEWDVPSGMEWARKSEAWDVPKGLEWERGWWEWPTRMKRARAPIGVGCAHLKGTGNRTNGVRCTHQNGMGKKPGGTLQEGIRWSPEGVGHTHWNRNEPKPDEEQEVGL